MTGRGILLAAATILGLAAWADFASGQSDMAADTAQIIENYRQSLSWLDSVSMQIDINGTPTGYPDKGPYGVTLLFRHDHGRAEWRGRIFTLSGNPGPSVDHTMNEIFTQQRYISFGNPVGERLRGALVSNDTDEKRKRLFENSGYGSPLWGRISGNNHKSVADLLEESGDLVMQEESIDNVPCFVLQGSTKYGRTTAWIAPQKGYSAVKWSIEKQGTDLFDNKPIPVHSWVAVFDSVSFQEIDEFFVPNGGVFVLDITYNEGKKVSSREEYTVSNVQLNPDFNSIGAFEVNLPNGLRIYSEQAPGIRYKWQDGNVVPDIDRRSFTILIIAAAMAVICRPRYICGIHRQAGSYIQGRTR